MEKKPLSTSDLEKLLEYIEPRLREQNHTFYKTIPEYNNAPKKKQKEEIDKVWQDFKRDFPSEILPFKKMYLEGDKGAMIEALNRLTYFYFICTGIDSYWICDEIEKMFEPHFEKMDKSETIGRLLHALIIYGCSKNQAEDAIAEWLLLSKSTVKNYYNKHKPYSPTSPNSGDFTASALGYNDLYRKKFPQHYTKAYQAFKKVGLESLNERYATFLCLGRPEYKKIDIFNKLESMPLKKRQEIFDNIQTPLFVRPYTTFKIILDIYNSNDTITS
tara:strand:- start:18 stop:839 length:822 start_codon:yes stop_codon:yes gene_type:complete